jgi:nucleoporin NDC1
MQDRQPPFFLLIFLCYRRHPYYLNGRPLFLIISQIVLSFVFTLRLSLQDRLLLRFSQFSQRPSPIVSVVVTALVLPLLATPFAAVITLLLRTVFTTLGIKMIARGGLAAIIRNVGVLGRAYSLGVMTIACWEWTESVFDFTVPQV